MIGFGVPRFASENALEPNRFVLEPEDGLIGIGSGGAFAVSAARALGDRDDMAAEAIARKAMAIAAEICIYTNHNVIVESLES